MSSWFDSESKMCVEVCPDNHVRLEEECIPIIVNEAFTCGEVKATYDEDLGEC